MALTLDIPAELVEAIAEQAAERAALMIGAVDGDRWMDTKDAAEYLGMPTSTLHKLTAARSIPFAQDTPGGKLYFKRSKLDDWREAA